MWLEEFKKGEVVFHINTEGDKFYVILSGSVDVNIPKETGKFSSLYTVVKLNAGAGFGEIALIRDGPRMAEIKCN